MLYKAKGFPILVYLHSIYMNKLCPIDKYAREASRMLLLGGTAFD